MKKFLKLCATFTLVGALFVGCIDNTEPPGVYEMRIKKGLLLEAKAEHERSKVLVETAKAELLRAKAAVEQAEAKLRLSLAAINDQQAEADKIKNDYEKAIAKAKVEAQIAAYNTEVQKQLALLEWQRMLTVNNHYAYLNALLLLEAKLAEAKIKELDNIIWRIKNLITLKAEKENQLGEMQARLLLYHSAEVPKIKALIEFELEQAEWVYAFTKNMMDIWDNIKAYAVDQSLDYAEKMKDEMELAYAKSIELTLQVDNERFNLAALQKAEMAAALEYNYGQLTEIAIPNVFSQVADDYFRSFKFGDGSTEINQGLGDWNNKWITTGVFNNTYSFYNAAGPFGAKALLGAKNAMEQLIQDSIYIERNRILTGKVGNLASYETQFTNVRSARNTNVDNVKSTLTSWRSNYDIVSKNGSGYWGVEFANYTTALLTYAAQAAPDAAALKNALDAIEGGDLEKAIGYIKGSNTNTMYVFQSAAFAAILQTIKDVLNGEFNGSFNLNSPTTSLVLGGVSFNPQALVELVWGKGNVAKFTALLGIIEGTLATYGYAYVLNAVMPSFYDAAKGFIGEDNYKKGPVMQQYKVNTVTEYLAWIALYVLFDNNKMTLGDGVLTINTSGYNNVYSQLLLDFLGVKSASAFYPGTYAFPAANSTAAYLETNLPQSTSKDAITAAHRFSLAGDYGLDGRMFGTSLASFAKAGTPAKALLDAENALRNKWIDWGNALGNLQTQDGNLFRPYHRTWSANNDNGNWTAGWNAGKGALVTNVNAVIEAVFGKDAPVPSWIAHNGGKNAVTYSTAMYDPICGFYFTPEDGTDAYYPLLVDDDRNVNSNIMYWSNPEYIPYRLTHVTSDPTLLFHPVYMVDYYPSIMLRYASFGVQWNRFLNIGLPVYNGDFELTHWSGDRSYKTGWNYNYKDDESRDGNIGYVGQAFIAYRNYKQYEFWYNESKNYQSYDKLLAGISGKIADLRGIVEDLYHDWVNASQAVVYKDYEIRAMLFQAELYKAAYERLAWAYGGIGVDMIVFSNEYEAVLNAYLDAEKALAVAKENMGLFNTYGVYTGNVFDNKYLISLVDDKAKDLQGKIDALKAEIEVIDSELAILEAEKELILSKVVSNYN